MPGWRRRWRGRLSRSLECRGGRRAPYLRYVEFGGLPLLGVLLEQSPARAEASGGIAASSFALASVDIDVQCERRQGVITTLDTALVPWHTFTGPSDGARREDRRLLGLSR